MMRQRDLYDFLENLFPLNYQEEYDNSGQQISLENEYITGILIAMDSSPSIIREAVENNCNVIITHHPLFFRPVDSVCSNTLTGSMIITCIQHSISVYSVHTNMDAVCWDLMAKTLQLNEIQLMFPDKRFDSIGYGAIGSFTEYMSLEQALNIIACRLHTKAIIRYGSKDKKIRTLATLNGAGSKKIIPIINNFKVDAIITGDVTYHDAVFANACDVVILDIGHYATEKPLIDFLYNTIHNVLTNEKQYSGIRVMVSEREQNPMQYGI